MGASAWALLGQAATALSFLLPVPFLVRFLGSVPYGVWAVANVLVGYLAFTDFGMIVAARRFGAIAHAAADQAEESRLVWTAAVLTAALTAVAAALMALFAWPLVQWLVHAPPDVQRRGAAALQLLALTYLFRAVTSVVAAPQLVRFRHDLNAILVSLFAAAQVAAVVIVLRRGGGLVAAAAAMAAVSAAALLAHLVASASLLKDFRRPALDRRLAGRLAAFGAPLAASAVAVAILGQSEKVILARFTSAAVVAHYAAAFTIANAFIIPVTALGQSLLPSFARAHAADEERLRGAYISAGRWTALLAVAAALVLAAAARPLFRVVFGPEFEAASTLPFVILLAGSAAMLAGTIPTILLQSVGRTRFLAQCQLAEIPLYLLLAVPLTLRYGAIGAAAAWSLRATADAIVVAWGAERHWLPARLSRRFSP